MADVLETGEQDPRGEGGRRAVQTRLANVAEVPAEYANTVHVNADRHLIQVVFSRFLQPMITTDEERDYYLGAETVDATVVARLLLPPEVVDQTVQLLQAFLDRNYTMIDEDQGDGEDHADGDD